MAKIYKEAECVYCKEVKLIAAKGLCRACYGRWKRNGKLEKVKVRNICEIPSCTDFVVSHGLCDKHRKRLVRQGHTDQTRPDDWGTRDNHPLYHYWIDTKRREVLNIADEWKDGFWNFVECVQPRPDTNHFLRVVDIEKPLGPDNWKWVEGIDKARREAINRKKGQLHDKKRLRVSLHERVELLIKAGNCCEICGVDAKTMSCPKTGEQIKKNLCVDHNHETGELRGILCFNCNSAIGHFKDSTELLRKAVLYLKKDN